jgi:hypothetical protein
MISNFLYKFLSQFIRCLGLLVQLNKLLNWPKNIMRKHLLTKFMQLAYMDLLGLESVNKRTVWIKSILLLEL